MRLIPNRPSFNPSTADQVQVPFVNTLYEPTLDRDYTGTTETEASDVALMKPTNEHVVVKRIVIPVGGFEVKQWNRNVYEYNKFEAEFAQVMDVGIAAMGYTYRYFLQPEISYPTPSNGDGVARVFLTSGTTTTAVHPADLFSTDAEINPASGTPTAVACNKIIEADVHNITSRIRRDFATGDPMNVYGIVPEAMWGDLVDMISNSDYMNVNQRMLIDGFIPRFLGVNWIRVDNSIFYKITTTVGNAASAKANFSSRFWEDPTDVTGGHVDNTCAIWFFTLQNTPFAKSNARIYRHTSEDDPKTQSYGTSIDLRGLAGKTRPDGKGSYALAYSHV